MTKTKKLHCVHALHFAGHDSELFSFLDPDAISRLETHPAAGWPLFTWGVLSADNTAFAHAAYWNEIGALAFTTPPEQQPELVIRGMPLSMFRTDTPVVSCTALVFIRYLFFQSSHGMLDGREWVDVADPGLRRLHFIRGPAIVREEGEWIRIRTCCFLWAWKALDDLHRHCYLNPRLADPFSPFSRKPQASDSPGERYHK